MIYLGKQLYHSQKLGVQRWIFQIKEREIELRVLQSEVINLGGG